MKKAKIGEKNKQTHCHLTFLIAVALLFFSPLVLDYLTIGIHEVASISERRIERLVNPQLSGLPAFLVNKGGLNSGFMIAHVMHTHTHTRQGLIREALHSRSFPSERYLTQFHSTLIISSFLFFIFIFYLFVSLILFLFCSVYCCQSRE